MHRLALLLPLFVAAVSAGAPAHAARCFSMFDAKNALVYQTANPPIDLSRSISDQMARRYPARYLVISDAGSCPESIPGSVLSASSAAALLPGRDSGAAGYMPDPGPVDASTRNDATTVPDETRSDYGDSAQPGPTGRVRR